MAPPLRPLPRPRWRRQSPAPLPPKVALRGRAGGRFRFRGGSGRTELRNAKMAAAVVGVSLRRGVPAGLLRAGPRPVRGLEPPWRGQPGGGCRGEGLGGRGGAGGVEGGGGRRCKLGGLVAGRGCGRCGGGQEVGKLRVGGDVKGPGRELGVGRVVEGPGRKLEVRRVCRGAWERTGD